MADPTVKSCNSCPSFVSAADSVNVFGRSIGSPMCYRHGTVLGKPGTDRAGEDKMRRHVAENCSDWGSPRPAAAPNHTHTVMVPLPELRDPENIKSDLMLPVNTCATCKNFVSEMRVADETGWTAGACAAKGILIPSNRVPFEARNCEYRQFGVSIGTLGGMMLFPMYTDSFLTGRLDPVAEHRKSQDNFIEPGEWPTDKEVTEGDRSAGIKSWREVKDPEGSGNSVFLPVYDASFFSDEDRELIPKTGDDGHPELYIDHFGGLYTLGVAWMELDETPVFWGEPGIGKTELLRFAAWIMQLPFRRLSITADSTVDDVAGTKEFSPDKGTYFSYGELPVAWTQPGVLCIDEPNVARDPGVWHFIRPLTDNSKQMVLTMNGNERLDRGADCYMSMAMNPAWDIRNSGALEVADADTNRLFHTYVPLPPPELEQEIIKARVRLDGWELSTDQLNMIMNIADDLRGLADAENGGALPVTWAIRQQIKVARALRWFAPATAYRRAIGDALDPEAQKIILDTVNAHNNSIF